MVIVDTSVWVDFLKGRETGQVGKLEELIGKETDIFTTGLVVQEVLSGILSKRERDDTRRGFDRFITVMPTIDTHVQAAEIFDACRKRGYTIRSVIDCVISALALEYGLSILESDRDYEYIAKVFPLKIFRNN